MKIYNVVLWAAMSLFSTSAVMAAQVLLLVDLNTENQITISATSNVSDATTTGPVFTGFYLDMFYNEPGSFVGARELLGDADLTSALNPTNNTPLIFRAGFTEATSDAGLSVFGFSTDGTISFEEDMQAFSGSATWLLSSVQYAEMLAGNSTGNIYFAADDVSDIPNAALIGEWQTVSAVPLPAAIWLFGSVLAGMGAVRRKKT